ncbi:MAG TPA: hypothetical protein VFP68_18910 [Burkholderiaceae bacterium]|nr:hypothetical protein [Burkholderiaceae bacterium]
MNLALMICDINAAMRGTRIDGFLEIVQKCPRMPPTTNPEFL